MEVQPLLVEPGEPAELLSTSSIPVVTEEPKVRRSGDVVFRGTVSVSALDAVGMEKFPLPFSRDWAILGLAAAAALVFATACTLLAVFVFLD